MTPPEKFFFDQVQNNCACPHCLGDLNLSHSIFTCGKCGTIYPVRSTIPDFLSDDPGSETTIDELSSLYDRKSEKYKGSPRSCGYASDSSFQHRLNIFKKWIDFSQIKNLKILDIGCGTGLMTQTLAGTNEVWGVDISAGLLHIAQNKGIRTIRCSARELPFKSGIFDLIVCMGVLPYYTDPDPIVSQICRVIQPRGKIVITSTTNSILIQWVRIFKNLSWKKSQLKRLYSPLDLEICLKKHGATVQDTCLGFNEQISSCKENVLPLRFKLLARVAAAFGTGPEK